MAKLTRETIQHLFIRVCHDSAYSLDSIRAANLVAQMIGGHPLDVWVAMPSLSVMDEIAAGTHPACRAALAKNVEG